MRNLLDGKGMKTMAVLCKSFLPSVILPSPAGETPLAFTISLPFTKYLQEHGWCHVWADPTTLEAKALHSPRLTCNDSCLYRVLYNLKIRLPYLSHLLPASLSNLTFKPSDLCSRHSFR